jgi:hypothetical protein
MPFRPGATIGDEQLAWITSGGWIVNDWVLCQIIWTGQENIYQI